MANMLQTYGDRRREDDRRRDSEGYSQKESSYGARKKSDSYSDQSERNRFKEKGKETDTQAEKDVVDREREKVQDRENGQYPGSYHGYRGQERDGKQRDRDYYRDGRKDDGRDYYRDGRREVKGDYRYDHGRPKESGKGPAAAKDSRYQRPEPVHSDHTGGRRFHQEPRGLQGSRSKPTSYDSRKDVVEKTRSYDNRKDRDRYSEKPSQSGKTAEKASSWSEHSKKEATPPHLEEILARRGSCDSTGSSTSDVAKANRGRSTNDGDSGETSASSTRKKGDDSDWGGRSNADKDSSGGSRQKIRYKVRSDTVLSLESNMRRTS